MTEQPTPRAAQEREPLLPCRHCGCGVTAKLRDSQYSNGPFDAADALPWFCFTCDACGYTSEACRSQAEAIAAWNRRPTPPSPADPRALRERLMALAERMRARSTKVADVGRSVGFCEAAKMLDDFLTDATLFAGDGGGWLPIESAPMSKIILLWALTDTETGNWKMATGYWAPGFGDEDGAWTWDGRRLRSYETQPTHWRPLPSPPLARPAPEQEGGR